MDKLIEAFRHPNVWAVSVQLLILYCVSVALFFAVDSGNRSASVSMKDGIKNGKALSQIVLFALAAASNALAVWTFVFICNKLSTVPRLAMVGLPLLLLVEKHVRAIRANQEHRRLELLLAAGVTIGIAGAMFALMRDCPFK
ncbi:MAG: hypothetical protein ACHQ2Z_13610 [Elusimicrobiota bacterium]